MSTKIWRCFSCKTLNAGRREYCRMCHKARGKKDVHCGDVNTEVNLGAGRGLKVICNTDRFIAEIRQVNKSMRGLSKTLARIRQQWLPTAGGEWPDCFVLLNRYLRTGEEPKYFSGERVEL
jgi:hypothetical protein